MFPILFSFGGIDIPAWHAFFALAACATFIFGHFLLKKRSLTQELLLWPRLFVACYISGWLGARALSIIVEQLEVTTFAQFLAQLFVLGPMTFYGGYILAASVGIAVVWPFRKHISLKQYADAAFPAAILGLGMGRIGCFLNGDDYGRMAPLGSWWAFVFPSLNDGMPRYATQLQEAAASFLIAGLGAFFWMYRPRFLAFGRSACLVIALSAANRFANEFYRGDARGAFFGSALSTSQGAAVLLCLAAGICFFLFKTPQEPLR